MEEFQAIERSWFDRLGRGVSIVGRLFLGAAGRVRRHVSPGVIILRFAGYFILGFVLCLGWYLVRPQIPPLLVPARTRLMELVSRLKPWLIAPVEAPGTPASFDDAAGGDNSKLGAN